MTIIHHSIDPASESIYPSNFEERLGFIEVRRLLEEELSGPLGHNYLAAMEFKSDFADVEILLGQTWEMKQILMGHNRFSFPQYHDLCPEFTRLRIVGSFMEPSVLPEFRNSLLDLVDILKFFESDVENQYPLLKSLAGHIHIDDFIESEIRRLVDERGRIHDNASEKLLMIRRDIQKMQLKAMKKMAETLLMAKKSGWTAEDAEPTIRNGRLVIPVASSNKRKLKGFVHDESATGNTAFIEPAEVFELNNEIADREADEKREIIRILTVFTNRLRPELPALLEAWNFLGMLDFIRAKAKLAIRINGILPLLVQRPHIEWFDAVHPLLYLSHKAQKKEVVPLNLLLNRRHRVLIISGPNAGGKSVCLKTVGLLQYMLQCGLLVPMRETSEAGVFKSIFVDIGDQQSIENDLSTYSSHLLNMKVMMARCRSHSLFLIDEFGAGTEPRLGGAIAEAVLEKLNERKAFGVITTHYANLKLMGDRFDGIINGAMLFDNRKMQPLFVLKTGKPGSSFAFEIARKMGIPKDVLDAAAQKSGEQEVSFDQQLQQLETEKLEIQKKQRELALTDELLFETLSKYQNLFNALEKEKREILKRAKSDAANLIQDANRLIENSIQEIRKQQAEKAATIKIREQLKEKREKLEKEVEASDVKEMNLVSISKPETEKPEDIRRKIMVDDFVKIIGQDAIGQVLHIRGEDALVSFNQVSVNTRLKNLLRAKAADVKKTSRKAQSMSDLPEKAASFNLSIDVRGKRAEEALQQVDYYLDQALLLSVKEIRILHGKGDGILRHIIREKIRYMKSVESFRDERADAGGDGVTVVVLV